MLKDIHAAKKKVDKEHPNLAINSGYESNFGNKKSYAFSGVDTDFDYPRTIIVLENGEEAFLEGPICAAYLNNKTTKKIF